MADKKMYKVGITVKEPWSADISYEVLDVTLYAVESGGDGCSYTAIKPNQGVTPGTDSTVWVKSTQAGQSIYDLAVKYHHFVGTEEEFEQQYQDALAAANNAASAASATDEQIQANELARVSAENSRVIAETARSDAETARSSAETARINAENARNNAESLRDIAESDRVRAEAGRVTAEASRVEAETFRQGAEQSRRQQFEALKTDMNTAIDNVDAKAAEIEEDIEGYEANEAARVTAEQSRVSAESSRVSAESARATAETARVAQASSDHTRAETDHGTAASDHTTAQADHTQAASDHTDITRARLDAETATSEVNMASLRANGAADTAIAAAADATEAAGTIDAKIATKQDTLVSGENIKTVNGQSILGPGDIPISGASDAVKYTSQSLTDAQKEQARANIGAADVAEVSQLRSEVDGEEITQAITRYSRQLSRYIKTDGIVYSTTSASSVVDTFRDILPNTKYLISGRVGNVEDSCLVCFYDANDAFITGSWSAPSTGTPTPYQDIEVTSPAGASVMRVAGNNLSSYPYVPSAKVVTRTKGVADRIEAIENEVKVPAFDISRLAYDEIYGFYIAGPTYKWVENSDGVTYIYRVRGGKKMVIVGNVALDSNYAFLTDYASPVAGSYPSFIPGYEQTYNISSNATIEVVPPIDCYMAVNCATSSGGIRYPQHIYIPGDNPFWGLKSIWQGPSTMYGLGTKPLRSRFSSRVAQFFGMSETNYGVSGSTIAKKVGSYESAFGSLAEFNAAVTGGLVDTSKRYLVKDNVSDVLPWTIYYYNGSDWVSVQRTSQNVERAPMVDRLSELDSDADVVVFQGSTNDFMYDWAEIGEDTDRIKTTIKGAVHLICQHLITAYPHKFIIWINGTCSYRYQGEYTTPFDKNNLQYSGWEEWDAVKEVLKQYSIPFIDMAGECGLTPENSTWWNDYDSEGTRVHPNHLGHLRLAKYLVSKMLMLKGLAK